MKSFSTEEPPTYTGDLDFASLTPHQANTIFDTWMVQCWLADNDPPQDEKGLAEFDLERLRRAFPHAYRAGDWRRMRPRIGADVVRAALLFSLRDREPYAVLTNRIKPIQEIGRLRRVWHFPAYHLTRTLATILLLRGEDEGDKARQAVWLHDGRQGHVVIFRRVDPRGKWYTYDETNWPNNLSLLSDGQNQLGVRATRSNWPGVGQFIVDSGGLERTITAVVGTVPEIELYRDIAEEVEQLQQNAWKFGRMPEGWGDPELAYHAWRRAIPGILESLIDGNDLQ